MKRKILFSVMMLAVLGLITMQSCKKAAPLTPKEFHSFTVPVAVTPADGASVIIPGATYDLTWESTNADGSPVLADVYFGTSENPPLYQSGLNALTVNVPVELGLTYFWQVHMTDKNGVVTKSPVFSFTDFEQIGIFVGAFNADEPAEAYSYDVNFTKTNATTITCDNYWNSGWVVPFVLDFTANTYSFPLTTFQTGWSGFESGTIDPATGTMVGNYIIYHNGVSYEEGVHTYTKL